MAQLFDVIFDDLRSSKKSVNRLLSLGVLFALFGHFCIVEPYFQHKEQLPKLVSHRQQVEEMNQGLKAILGDVNNQIIEYSAEFTIARAEIYQRLWRQEPLTEPFEVRGIILPAGTTFEKGVPLFIETWFTNLINKLKFGVTAEVAKVSQKKSEDSSLQSIADQALTDFQDGLKKLKEDDPEIWSKYGGEKGKETTDKLQNLVKDVFEPVNQEVDSLIKDAAKELENVKGAIDILDSRIKSLLSELGPLPVSLTDFIVLFPIIIIALSVMITAALHKSCHLYKAFWHEFSKENTTMGRDAFQLLADCWYLPPDRSIVKLLLLVALLVVISGMYIWASVLVIINAETKLFSILTPAAGSFTKIVFTCAYILGAFVVLGCFGLIVKTLRRTTQEAIE